MSGHRQSALLLHGLDRADQRWIMARLERADARILDGHLSELRQLGIPADPALGARHGSGVGAAATVHGASAAAMTVLLADEPVWLVRHLLALGQWPWREAYLASLTPAQRERIGGTSAPALASQAGQCLLATVAARLAAPVTPGAAPAQSAPARPRAWWQQALRRWT